MLGHSQHRVYCVSPCIGSYWARCEIRLASVCAVSSSRVSRCTRMSVRSCWRCQSRVVSYRTRRANGDVQSLTLRLSTCMYLRVYCVVMGHTMAHFAGAGMTVEDFISHARPLVQCCRRFAGAFAVAATTAIADLDSGTIYSYNCVTRIDVEALYLRRGYTTCLAENAVSTLTQRAGERGHLNGAINCTVCRLCSW
jgi:hypothetical protein